MLADEPAETPEKPSSTTPRAAASASKRSAASLAASSDAANARGEAARKARTPAASGAKSRATTAEARRRAATTRQRVAASITTETTEAERPPRKSGAAAAAASVTEPAVVPEPVVEHDVVVAEAVADEAAVPEAATAADVATVVEEPAPPVVDSTTESQDATMQTLASDAPADGAPGAAASVVTAPPADDRAIVADQAVAVIPVTPRAPKPRKKRTLRVARAAPPVDAPRVLAIEGLVKRFGDTTAVDAITLDVRAGSFYGIVGPNGAGKTTTLSMVTGLLRPDGGRVLVNGIDVWTDPKAAKRTTGVLPDRLRLFDRLTGSELLYYSGVLRGLDDRTVRERSAELAAAFGLEDALDRLVADYSAGMTKKVALACAMIHAPRLLVLDEPFESVDPVSAANLTDILERYVAGGGTVLLSSHGMDLIERVCDSAAIIVAGRVLASGTLDEVRGGHTLEDRFVELAGGRKAAEGMEWLHSFSD